MAGLGVVELDRLDEFASVRFGPIDFGGRRDRNDEILVQRHASVRGQPDVGLVDTRIHDPGDFGRGGIPYIYLVDCPESVDDIHPAVVDERRTLMAA